MLKKTGILPRAVKPRFVFLIVILTFVWVNLLSAQNTVVPFYDINQNGRQDDNEPMNRKSKALP